VFDPLEPGTPGQARQIVLAGEEADVAERRRLEEFIAVFEQDVGGPAGVLGTDRLPEAEQPLRRTLDEVSAVDAAAGAPATAGIDSEP